MESLRRLKAQFDENPALVIGVLSGAALAAARFIDAIGGLQSKHAYSKQVSQRTKKK